MATETELTLVVHAVSDSQADAIVSFFESHNVKGYGNGELSRTGNDVRYFTPDLRYVCTDDDVDGLVEVKKLIIELGEVAPGVKYDAEWALDFLSSGQRDLVTFSGIADSKTPLLGEATRESEQVIEKGVKDVWALQAADPDFYEEINEDLIEYVMAEGASLENLLESYLENATDDEYYRDNARRLAKFLDYDISYYEAEWEEF